MRLSLCTIVRDEAEHLPALLASVRGVVDELCVLDTGSTDGTPELARRAGARVGHFAWCDDFAAARNAALELATGDWVLALDADERLEAPGARARLEAFARRLPDALGRVLLVNGSEAGASSIALTRFFPRVPSLRYRGRVHEQLVDAHGERLRHDTGVVVHHLGYAAEVVAGRDKLARNRRLLEAALVDEPDNAYLWYQLGRTEFVAEDHAAAWSACARAVERLAGADAAYAASLHETAAYALRQLGRSAEARELLLRLLPRYAARADTRFALALCDLDVGRLAEAEAGFQACLQLEDEAPEGGEASRSACTWAPAFNLGVMHEVLEHVDEAVAWYRRALRHHPGHAPSLAALERCGRAHASLQRG
ncbi:MAG: glycosyltransferase family 2 protein [Planctomycetes bacterium]|nr:glycosyltransferase family 2 protein [Planctomycetota bacterium]